MRVRSLKISLLSLATMLTAVAISGMAAVQMNMNHRGMMGRGPMRHHAAASDPPATKPNGANIFQQKCAMCHGVDGKGFAAIQTPNFTDPKWQAAHPEKERLDALENGVKGTAMVSFKGKLNEAEMHAVLDYIHSLGSKGSKNSQGAHKK